MTKKKFVAMITEINIVDGSDGFWIDIDVSCQVCYDRVIFKTYIVVENKKVLLVDSHITNVLVMGDMKLKFTSRKFLILKDVMHSPKIRNNMVLGFLLNKAELTQFIGYI